MSNCPVKKAAIDAPHHLAILSQNGSLTFQEFDQYVDQLVAKLGIRAGSCLVTNESTSVHLIALFFAVWRARGSIFPINPRLPKKIVVDSAPESSLLIFTSGSNGTPKVAILSLSNLITSADGAIDKLELRANDQWRLTLPLYHVGGIGILFRCILARATIVLNNSPDITHLSYVPTHLYRSTPIYKKLRCLLLGGAPVRSYPKELPVFVTYGLTEMSSMVVLRKKPEGPYLGHPLEGREVRVGEDGEIWVKGECLFQGYLGETISRDWFPTGDLGVYCPKEGLAIIGRKDWQFISGGENIQPEEIEKELLALDGVNEAIVVPIDDPEFGQRPAAVISGQLDFSKMQQALSEKLPKYKIPVTLHQVKELPKIGFKVNRSEIIKIIDLIRHN